MSDKTELLMKIVVSGARAIPAECALAINPADQDQLMEGFEAGRFFQIKDFNFGVGLQDDQGSPGGGGGAGGAAGGPGAAGPRPLGVFAAKPSAAPYASTRAAYALMQGHGQGKGQEQGHAAFKETKTGKSEEKPKKPGGGFARWRAERPAGAGSTRYPLEVEPVSFTRWMDQASTTLLQALCDSESLVSASIVRRAVIGDSGISSAYLRLDFTDVLITSIDWEDDDVIEEKLKFICRGVQVRFRPQASDGSLGPPISGVWPAK